MNQSISSNKRTLYGRLIFVFALVWMLYGPVSNLINRPFDKTKFIIFIFFFGFILVLSLFLIAGLFFTPIAVEIDKDRKISIIKYLVTKEKQLNLSDIKGYSNTELWTWAKHYKGLLLYLNDNTKVELTDYNLKSHIPILNFLKEMDVQYYGSETSWFPFSPYKYKY